MPAQSAAQSALAATQVDLSRLPHNPSLTLRPEAGLELIATKVARVLALRTGMVVEVGDAPPPGLLEAVPAGHLALARNGVEVRLVLGAELGRSFEASVQLEGDAGESDVRSVALAVETLRDHAVEARARLSTDDEVAARAADGGGQQIGDSVPGADEAFITAASGTRDDDASALGAAKDKRLRPVQPYFFLNAYSGASPESSAPRFGVGGGGGLCVLGHCLVLAVEYPIPVALSAGGGDIRYRYTTFTSGFYTHPLRFGRFTPAAGVAFLSRIGYFERDMGLEQSAGLDTDLGVRGTLAVNYELMPAVDLVSELGLDYALDRYRLGHGDAVAYRGERLTPWLQAGVRLRPY